MEQDSKYKNMEQQLDQEIADKVIELIIEDVKLAVSKRNVELLGRDSLFDDNGEFIQYKKYVYYIDLQKIDEFKLDDENMATKMVQYLMSIQKPHLIMGCYKLYNEWKQKPIQDIMAEHIKTLNANSYIYDFYSYLIDQIKCYKECSDIFAIEKSLNDLQTFEVWSKLNELIESVPDKLMAIKSIAIINKVFFVNDFDMGLIDVTNVDFIIKNVKFMLNCGDANIDSVDGLKDFNWIDLWKRG